jgi:hypothetical protein
MEEHQLDETLVGPLFTDEAELQRYRNELSASGLLETLAAAREEFQATVSGSTARGKPYRFGAISFPSIGQLYALVRRFRPTIAVETGVCNGVSTTLILLALKNNGQGRLFSIDLPEYPGNGGSESEFWSGKGGAVVPLDRKPGWFVPDDLRDSWELTLGRSQDELGPLLERLGSIDFFLHDGEHSYECMTSEYELAFAHLREGGILASDDTHRNSAFADFAASVSRPPYSLGGAVAAIVK